MPIEKVSPGQPYSGFPANTYNRIADVVNAFDNGQLQLNPQSFNTFKSAGIVQVLNDGPDLDRYGVLGIKEPVILPSADLEEFRVQLRVRGITPAEEHVPDTCVILQEPLASGEVGYGAIAGASIAKIVIELEDHTHAGCEEGTTANLVSRASGGMQILWKEAGTGLKNAIVRFVGQGGNDAIVKVDGSGSDVTENSFCLWSGKLQEFDLGAGTACSPWINGEDIWITIAGDVPDPLETRKLKSGSRFRAQFKGQYKNRPLYVMDLPGLVSVSSEDNPNYLFEQQADQVAQQGSVSDITPDAASGVKDGDIIAQVQNVLDGQDEKLRYYESVSGFEENTLQALSHDEGSTAKSWFTPVKVTVITEIRIVGTAVERRTAEIEVFSNTDLGWGTLFQGTDCSEEDF